MSMTCSTSLRRQVKQPSQSFFTKELMGPMGRWDRGLIENEHATNSEQSFTVILHTGCAFTYDMFHKGRYTTGRPSHDTE